MKYILITFNLLFIIGCGGNEAAKSELPIINNDNCKKSAINNYSKDVQEKMISLCLRESRLKNSDHKEW